MNRATAMIDGLSTSTASAMSPLRRMLRLWMCREGATSSSSAVAGLGCKVCISRRLNKLGLHFVGVLLGGHDVEHVGVVGHEALFGRRAVDNAGGDLVALEVVDCALLILVVLAQVGVGARRDRALERVEGVLPIFRATDLEPVHHIVAILGALGQPKRVRERHEDA